MQDRSARTWIWASLILQFLGYVLDVIWHGLLNPGVEPRTVEEMARHLGTVHLPLYIGAASVLVSTSRALLRQIRRSATGIALPIAFAGAVLSAGAEAWHAYSHLRLDTHSAPVAGTLSLIGFLVVVIAMSLSNRARRRRAGDTTNEQHAASSSSWPGHMAIAAAQRELRGPSWGLAVLVLSYVLPWMTRPSRIVVRTFANARTSCAGSPSSTTMSAASPGARRPVGARPKRAAGAVVSIARICAGASPARCRYTNSSVGS